MRNVVEVAPNLLNVGLSPEVLNKVREARATWMDLSLMRELSTGVNISSDDLHMSTLVPLLLVPPVFAGWFG